MNYELVKQLKDAGFSNMGDVPLTQNMVGGVMEYQNLPRLSELIEACGADDICLSREDGTWKAMYGNSSEVAVLNEWDGDYCATGNSIEEAVARLWLALNKK